MKITFLGTGDMFSVEQYHNSMLAEFGGTHLVIDFPESNARALKEYGFPMTDIHNVFITHLHEDHINGVQMLGYYAQIVAIVNPVCLSTNNWWSLCGIFYPRACDTQPMVNVR